MLSVCTAVVYCCRCETQASWPTRVFSFFRATGCFFGLWCVEAPVVARRAVATMKHKCGGIMSMSTWQPHHKASLGGEPCLQLSTLTSVTGRAPNVTLAYYIPDTVPATASKPRRCASKRKTGVYAAFSGKNVSLMIFWLLIAADCCCCSRYRVVLTVVVVWLPGTHDHRLHKSVRECNELCLSICIPKDRLISGQNG